MGPWPRGQELLQETYYKEALGAQAIPHEVASYLAAYSCQMVNTW